MSLELVVVGTTFIKIINLLKPKTYFMYHQVY